MVQYHKETGFARYEKGMVKEAIHRAWKEKKDEAAEDDRFRAVSVASHNFYVAMWWHEHFWRWVPFSRRVQPVKADIPDSFDGFVDWETQRIFDELLGLIDTCDDTHILLSPTAVKVCGLDDNLYGRLPE